jgi:uncharacterized protein with PQ loop repeat
VLDLLVTIVGVAMGLSPILQIIRTRKRRHSADVSLPMFSVIFVGAVLWLCYGVEHGLSEVIVANAAGAVMNLAAIVVVLHYRHPPAETG